MKLDLGCGYKKRDGYTRVDHDNRVIPDIKHDLNTTPYKFAKNDSVDEILLIHVLEHLGNTPDEYKKIWQEIYRICKPDAVILIEVPHWRHDNFYHDPTHVRVVTPITIDMMNCTKNLHNIASGGCETTLGLQWKVDFELASVNYEYDPVTGTPVSCHYKVIAKKPMRIK